jgi:hypothetical protein
VAAGGIFFATEQGDRAGPDLLLQPTYTIEERAGTPDQRVVHPSLRVVELPALGPSAELPAEEKVSDAVLRQRYFEGAGVEARRVPGVWMRTGVDNNLYRVSLQQVNEFLRGMVGMAYGEYEVLYHLLSPMIHSSLGNVAGEVEDNPETLLSPDLLWRAPGNRLYTLGAVGVWAITCDLKLEDVYAKV